MERHYDNGTEPDVLPHWDCHGPCQRGQCPTPDACERPDAPQRSDALMIVATAILAFAAVACAYLVAMVAANLWSS